jgi:uncharacterized membrane protein YraQ (UPF0718 family)
VRHLGNNRFASVFKAALPGVSLPLCSCGVIPAAISFHKQGANKGATAEFLISVPETGGDSMAITWALLDPIMTVIRPVAAFVTATFAGVMINLLPKPSGETSSPSLEKAACGCSSSCSTLPAPENMSMGKKLKTGLEFAFGQLPEDTGKWLVVGIVMAGVFTALLPADFFERYLSNEFSGLLIMLLAGIPLYILYLCHGRDPDSRRAGAERAFAGGSTGVPARRADDQSGEDYHRLPLFRAPGNCYLPAGDCRLLSGVRLADRSLVPGHRQ